MYNWHESALNIGTKVAGVKLSNTNYNEVTVNGLTNDFVISLPRTKDILYSTINVDVKTIPAGESDLMIHNVTVSNTTTGVQLFLKPDKYNAIYDAFFKFGKEVTTSDYDTQVSSRSMSIQVSVC